MPRSCCRGGRSRRGLLVVLAATAAACAPLTVSQEKRLGQEFEREARAQLPLLHDRVVVGYVRSIGFEILRAAGPQPFEYDFSVVDDGEINAFAGPAGHIYVNTGTILKARNVSELAGVIGHEVGHVVHRHVADNYNKQRTAGIGQQLLVLGAGVLAGGAAAEVANLGGGLTAMLVLNKFGREAEQEADTFALATLPQAGYDPHGMVSFFETLKAEGGSRVPTFLSSHPTTQDRIDSARRNLAARRLPAGLRTDDGGRLEIIQRRIRLLAPESAPSRR